MVKNKKYLSLMILSVLFMIINPADACSQESNESLRNKVRLGVGLSIGIGLTVAHGVLLFGYTPHELFGNKVLSFLPTAPVAIAISILTTNLFFDIFSKPAVNKWVSIPLGGLGGAVEGALIGGVTYSVFFGAMSIINPEFANTNNFGEALWMGFSGGAAFGSMIGLIPGAVMAPCIRIFLPEQ